MAIAALACRGLIGMVFAVSVFSKVRSGSAFRAFTSWLAALPLPPGLVRTVGSTPGALMVAASEAAVVLLLALAWTWPAGLLLAAGVLAVYTAGTAVAARSGTRVPCRCFGEASAPIGARHVARNVVLLAIAAAGAAQTAAGLSASQPRPAGIALALGVAAAAAMSVVFLDDIAALFTGPGHVPGTGGRPD